jgi:hypothetical protein
MSHRFLSVVLCLAILPVLGSCTEVSIQSKCIAGTAVACDCSDGSYGTSVCDPKGMLGVCLCGGGHEDRPPALCPPGAVIDCLCSSVHVGEASCNVDGTAGVCACPQVGDCSGPSTGTSFGLRLARIELPSPTDVIPIGLDLDGHFTKTASDPIGCGKIDSAEGIDNQLGVLLPLVEDVAGTGSLEALINSMVGIVDGLLLDVNLEGFDGVGDPGVRIEVIANGIVRPRAGSVRRSTPRVCCGRGSTSSRSSSRTSWTASHSI